MIRKKFKMIISAFVITTLFGSPFVTVIAKADTVSNNDSGNVTQIEQTYKDRFMTMRNKLHDPSNGYFKKVTKNGKELLVPYHSTETFMVEAPDYGHETTSEGYSYYMWLEALYGKFTGDWDAFKSSWDSAEAFIIPHGEGQKGADSYNPSSPATLANEYLEPEKYPSRLQFGSSVGKDPLYNELKNTYGTSEVYGMHWLLDTDNWYGYGDKNSNDPVYINTYQRGPNESVWETIPHPSIEKFQYGGKNGYLDLFTGDNSYARQWRYTDAPDADARAIQATYLANTWAKESGVNIKEYTNKASKMGDYLRYAMFDKYFKNIGVGSNGQESSTNQHYVLGWYYSWGGGLDANWSWRIGSGICHFGYQNPLSAWVLSNDSDFKPKSANGASDWNKSLQRQLEFYQWLQSDEGAIAGGSTNSLITESGSYSKYPEGTSTFYGMAYDPSPSYLDPESNKWFGMQAWSMQRLAEYYYNTGDKKAQAVLDKWVKWVKGEVKLNNDGTFEIPTKLQWSGQPDTWNGTYTGNKNLHVKVIDYGTDLGISASLANTLFYYAAGTNKYSTYDDTAASIGKELLDRMWNLYQDDKGVSATEKCDQYYRFFDQDVYVPNGWSGKMPNGDEIKPGIKFCDIRTKYKQDPDYNKVLTAYKNGEDPEFNYHRFWAESEVAIANGTLSVLAKDLQLKGEVLKGDVNNDGKVTLADYIVLHKYLEGNKSFNINEKNADVNGDGQIGNADLFALRKLLLKD